MRVTKQMLITFAVLSLSCTAVAAAGSGSKDPVFPGVVALSEDQPGHWVYKSFPGFLPLYVFEGDRPGKSQCDAVCAAVWPVLRAEPGDQPIGDWSIVARADGNLQWAYKDQPVYTFYMDTPNNPHGVGKRANWYNDEFTPDGRRVSRKVAASTARPAWRLLAP